MKRHLFALTTCLLLAQSAMAASNRNGPIIELTPYEPSASTQSKLSLQTTFAEVYPMMPSQDDVNNAIQQFEDEGLPPSDQLVALMWGKELRLEIADRETTLDLVSMKITRNDGTPVEKYEPCEYPQYGDKINYAFKKGKFAANVQLSVDKYYPQHFSKMTNGTALLDLEKSPSLCMKTQKANLFATGYIDLFMDDEKKQTVTIMQQQFITY